MLRALSLDHPADVRRVAVLAIAALLGAVAMLGTVTSPADAAPASVVLAVDGAELLGPDPIPRTAEDNPARELGGYEDRDIPFTWGAAWLLTFLGFGGLATMGLVYWLRVERPNRAKAPARR
jgi:hypothetical protein